MRYVKIEDHVLDDEARWTSCIMFFILDAFGEKVDRLDWTVEYLDVWGPEAEPLRELEGTGTKISGKALRDTCRAVGQIIWGHFVGHDPLSGEWNLQIQAIDSSYYEVVFKDSAVPSILRNANLNVVELDDWPGPEYG